MQNVVQGTTSDSQKSHEKQPATSAAVPQSSAVASGNHQETGKTSSTPQSSNSSPTKSETETFSELQPRFMTDSSESEEDSVSEVKMPRSREEKREREIERLLFALAKSR